VLGERPPDRAQQRMNPIGFLHRQVWITANRQRLSGKPG